MPRPKKKVTKKVTKKAATKKRVYAKPQTTNNWSRFRMSESYVSLLVGIGVVILVLFGIISFMKNRPSAPPQPREQVTQEAAATSMPTSEPTSVKPMQSAQVVTPTTTPYHGDLPTTHIVKSGESLWDISVAYYGTGYNWVDIVHANNIDGNPGMIYKGTKLVIPEVAPKRLRAVDDHAAMTQRVHVSNEITAKTYTIQKGDDLWDIAVRAYGDGYQWVDIAKANKLIDPGLIHTGNVLQIPR